MLDSDASRVLPSLPRLMRPPLGAGSFVKADPSPASMQGLCTASATQPADVQWPRSDLRWKSPLPGLTNSGSALMSELFPVWSPMPA